MLIRHAAYSGIQPMRRATESTPPSAIRRGRPLLVDLLVMGCTGASIVWYAHKARQDLQTGADNLAPLITFTAIAVLVGTIALQLLHLWLSRKSSIATGSQHGKPVTPHSHMNPHPGRRARSSTKALPRSGRVRFSGRS
jgi:hypothetical protein